MPLTGRTPQGRRYLDYDLAAVREYISAQKGCERVFVAIQDSEAFDSTLLASLVNVLRYLMPLFAPPEGTRANGSAAPGRRYPSPSCSASLRPSSSYRTASPNRRASICTGRSLTWPRAPRGWSRSSSRRPSRLTIYRCVLGPRSWRASGVDNATRLSGFRRFLAHSRLVPNPWVYDGLRSGVKLTEGTRSMRTCATSTPTPSVSSCMSQRSKICPGFNQNTSRGFAPCLLSGSTSKVN